MNFELGTSNFGTARALDEEFRFNGGTVRVRTSKVVPFSYGPDGRVVKNCRRLMLEVRMAKVYRFNFKNLDAYQAAVGHFSWVLQVVADHPRMPFVIRDQLLSAAISIFANIGEANGRDRKPGETEQHYRYAQGSTYESAAYLDALSAMGAIEDDEYNVREENLGRIAGMLTRLMQRQARRR